MDPVSLGQQIKAKFPAYAKYQDAQVGQLILQRFGGMGQQLPGVGQPAGQSMASNGPTSSALSLIQKYFPADQVQNALKVMQGESGGRANAIGDNYPIDTGNGPETIPSYGLFQIRGLPGRPAPQQLLDPEQNVKYAADLYKRSGWSPWTAARKLGLVNKG